MARTKTPKPGEPGYLRHRAETTPEVKPPEYKSGKYKIGTALSYTGVLNQIENELAAVRQWAGMQSWALAAEHEARAAALIELLEVQNCGSVGGFDRGQQNKDQNPTLESRWRWLANEGRRHGT